MSSNTALLSAAAHAYLSSDLLPNVNLSNWEKLVTDDEFRDFIKLVEKYKYPNHTQDAAMPKCHDYCTGELYQMLRTYNGVHGYVALLICIFGTIANILNIIVLTKKDMAKAPINKILKWLAIADMFVMIEYIPFASYQYIYMKPGEKDFSYAWAVFVLFHMHFTQVLHTISIGLTVTLAIWRYVAIRHPHGRFAAFLLSHCTEAIVFSFIVSPIVCFPTLFVFKVRESYVEDSKVPLYHVYADKDTQLYRINFWIHSVIIKLLPCCILTVISFILVRVLCEASKRKQKLKEYNNPTKTGSANGGASCAGDVPLTEQRHSQRPPKCDRRTDRTTMLLVAVLILFLVTEFPQGILGLLSGVLAKCFFFVCYPPFGEMMDLLALINAAVGFVLYGLMSKQFRTTFKSLFFKKNFGSMEMTRLTRVTTTCV
ncbi:G-protein coupled receptor dmsr-1 [Zeugodacus cucurbitae]|uniref:G-protein coupled receptor dmsr-1 n=1 Tax=Zeugodacus cucurbitae TaxID=28588 RepID=UPI0023D90B83|nr:G-protein coupled receptor dmsr-1 [Zeugodacus cucurbitae]XP_054090638.1 G-protein coupled receptor dmsr-1 [Zeugodacus cucurbitae]XP_054090639.1 G-protein coupled receptor dmsr-1 [Zeugodacus cucurbitae]XP_054090640.1 G-protein coupled receptor dmsr-1 [Zeugodacus cucurbitae]XP_054090641.1 G-protein coupled receptor dmsr-1 [Zeugodacus cucurbitae]XP_054090642.1 G-protein coupled receptor dmsr-1 [Zeugodacus cucurbitae]XP_054090643.1 G-protein coupled receptor dmsr-1 [Zeugodacus cucurbitae]XP_0